MNKTSFAVPNEQTFQSALEVLQHAQCADENILAFDWHQSPDAGDAVDDPSLREQVLKRGHRRSVRVINSMELDGVELLEPSDFRLNRRTNGDNASKPTRAGALSCKIGRILEYADVRHDRQIQQCCRGQGHFIATTLIEVNDVRPKFQASSNHAGGGL